MQQMVDEAISDFMKNTMYEMQHSFLYGNDGSEPQGLLNGGVVSLPPAETIPRKEPVIKTIGKGYEYRSISIDEITNMEKKLREAYATHVSIPGDLFFGRSPLDEAMDGYFRTGYGITGPLIIQKLPENWSCDPIKVESLELSETKLQKMSAIEQLNYRRGISKKAHIGKPKKGKKK
jgi:hypothetical protein